jgi:NAD(P)H-flavin reductase
MEWNGASRAVKFFITRRGKGTEELSQMRAGEEARLTGPLGNAWSDFLPAKGKTALVGGGAGVAPLAALVAEMGGGFHFYAGFKHGFRDKQEEAAMLGAALNAEKTFIVAEDGKNALHGRVVDFFNAGGEYAAVFACGPEPMLQALKIKCDKAGLPCFISMERRMACGVGACLGCAVRTVKGNRRCCADGPIFPAGELIFDE